jgi:tetratricopeptide (TPR) repeat protein
MKLFALCILFFCLCTISNKLDFQDGKKLLTNPSQGEKKEAIDEFFKLLAKLDIPKYHLDSLSHLLYDYNSTISRGSLSDASIETLACSNTSGYNVLKLVFVQREHTEGENQNICIILSVRNSQGNNVLLKSFVLRHCRYVQSDVTFNSIGNNRYAVNITDAPRCRSRKEWTVQTDTIVVDGQKLKYLDLKGARQEFSKSIFDDEESPVLQEYPENGDGEETHVISNNLSSIHEEAVELFKNGKKDEAVTLLMDSAGKAFIEDIANGKNDISSDNVEIFNDLGYFLEQTGNVQDAITILNAVVTMFPDRYVAYLNLGDAFAKVQHHERMVECYQKYYDQMTSVGKKEKIPSRVLDSLGVENN